MLVNKDIYKNLSNTYTFKDLCTISFGRGKFDNYCIYIIEEGSRKVYFPLDTDYRSQLNRLNTKYDNNYIYRLFIDVYSNTGIEIEQKIIEYIKGKSSSLQSSDKLRCIKTLVTIYYAMIAEQKLNKPLKKEDKIYRDTPSVTAKYKALYSR